MIAQVLSILTIGGLTTLVGLVFSIVTTRLIGPQEWGFYFGQIWPFAAFGALTDLGLEPSMAKLLKNTKTQEEALATALVLRLLLAVPLLLALILSETLGSNLGPVRAILFLDFFATKIGLIFKTATESACHQVTRPFVLETYFSVSGSAITLFLAVFFKAGWLALALGFLFRNLCQAAVNYWFCPIKIRSLVWPKMTSLKIFFSTDAAKLQLSALIGMFLYDFLPFLLLRISGPLQAGLFSRSFSLATIPLNLVGSLGRLTKRLTHLAKDKMELKKQVLAIQITKALFLTPPLLAGMILGPSMLQVLFGPFWAKAGPSFQLLCLYSLARCFYDDLTWVTTVGLKNATPFLICQVVQSTLCLTFGPMLIFYAGTAGAAAVAAFSMSATTLLFWLQLCFSLQIGLPDFQEGLKQVIQQTIEFLSGTFAKSANNNYQRQNEIMTMKHQKQVNKKILIVSQFQESSLGYCYADLFKNLALEGGNLISTLDCKKNYFKVWAKSSGNLPQPLRGACNLITNLALIWKCIWFQPDVLLLVKGENIWYSTLRLLKKIHSFKLINFYPDSPFCFWNGNSTSHVLKSLPLYDRFAIWSKTLAPILLSAGAKQVFYWPFVPDTGLFNPARVSNMPPELIEYFRSEVCFVGQHDDKRERFLTHLVKILPKVDLKIWGNEWKTILHKNSPLQAYLVGHELQATELCKAISGAKIVLNFLRDQNVNSHNQRTFEVASMRAFLLTERSAEQAEELFKEDESIACFRTEEELVEQIQKYLSEDGKRLEIATAAKAQVEGAFNPIKLFGSLINFQ